STFILAALRNQQFLSLRELNEAVWDRLYGFNHKPFQKKNGSRASAFEEEKLFLLPLPGHPFELATWRIATVQYNYHISVDTQNYSCPYEYIKQKVDVRMTRSTVEIFFDGNRIASHPRLYGRPNQYSTLEAHMPPDHLKYIQWEWRALHQLGGKGWSEHDFGHSVIPEQICRRAAGLQILYGIIEADGQVSAAVLGSRLQQSFFFHGIPKSQKHTVHTTFRTEQTARAGSGKILHLSIRFH